MRWRTGKSIRLLMYCALAVCAPILFLCGCGSGGGTGASPGQQETAAHEQDGDAEGNAGAAADGSAGAEQTGGGRSTVTDILMPEASGETTYQNDDGSVTLDLSHTDQGYIMIRDTNDKKVQIQITNPTGEMYPYPMNTGDAYRTFPLTCGDGGYSVRVLENISGDQYAIGLSQDFSVTLQDEFRPFLYPNQYVEYTADSDAVKLGQKLSGEAADDLGYVQNVYNYVISNITYDTEMAENLPVNYIPDPDATLASGKGICFDYASLMTAMLRSQGVPTKLVTGYSGEAYHAWISVYLKEQGWVDNIISFDGKKWTLVDPTLGANNDAKDVAKYIGDGKNYTVKYVY
ncbi:MAG: transglutaminase-like domain-containing protein [Bilifractor sp.]|jgi:hypothetical protein